MILITGATGHIGNALVRELLSRGERVRAMVLPGESCAALNGLAVETAVGNVLDPEALDRVMAGVTTVYHLAGIVSIVPGEEELMQKVNVDGARNVAAAALKAGVQRMIHISSIHALRREPHGVTIDEKTPLATEFSPGSYDRTKAEGTLAVLKAVQKGLDAVVVCPTGIIGPHDYLGSETGQLVKTFACKKLHFLVDGAFDFVDVRDVAAGLIRAAERGRTGEIYILSGHRVSLEELRTITQNAAGIRTPLVVVPFKLALFFARFTQHFYRWTNTTPQYTSYSLQTVTGNSFFNGSKALLELGYSPRPLEETIADTLAWHKEYYQKHYRKKLHGVKFRFWRARKAHNHS